MTKTITLIRHGQSKFNVGQCKNENELRNCELTDVGIQQAKTLNFNFDVCIVSTLKRALQTYICATIKSEIVIHTDLVREQRENTVLNYLVGEEIKPESPDDMRKRVDEAIRYIKTLEHDNIGIVTHAHFIWYFLERCGHKGQILGNACHIKIDI